MPAGPPAVNQPDPAESFPDRLIREAMAAGEFDDLPGSGKPIPGRGTPDDAGWWIRDWVGRNRLENDQEPKSPE